MIMPTYNASRFLAGSIDSVLNQTYRNLELLIADDCSSDKATIELLKDYMKKDPRVKVFFQKENAGPGEARNVCIRNAQGRYIAFCDSDDRWVADKIERQIRSMEEHDCALCCSSYILCDQNDEERGLYIAPEWITFDDMMRDNKIGCLTAVYDVKRLGRKFYMPTLRKRQDWALFLSIVRECGHAYGIAEPLAYYRMRKGSVSSHKLSLIKYNVKVYQTVLGFSTLKSYMYFFFRFIPSYTTKITKRTLDSYKYLKSKKQGMAAVNVQ